MEFFNSLNNELAQYEFPPVIWIAVPLMFFFIAIEAILAKKKNKKIYDKKDLWGSIWVGVGNLIANFIVKGFVFIIVYLIYKMSPYKFPPTWWSFLLCLIAIDFVRYWAHRWGHKNRFLWATHMTHHTSEYLNFAVSFRLNWIQSMKFVFFLPIAFLGFDPFIFFIAHQVGVLYQFWLHTELIPKLHGAIEYIFVTPSHHRVHHGRDDKYIDKNFGSTFIFWDRMFGTFQIEDERPNFGITKPINSNNPFKLNFNEFQQMHKDCKKAKGLKGKFLSIFGKT